MRAYLLILPVVLLVICNATLQAKIIHVPADSSTIQAGIDGADEGDTVLVAEGIYTGDGNRDIDFSGKAIVVMSKNGPEVTFIDCEGSVSDRHRGFNFHSGEDTTSVVQGFTIKNGHMRGWPYFGGGIYCENSSPTITNNIITQNYSEYNGGGIHCTNSSPKIVNNTISENTSGQYGGGGIYCENSSPTIFNNVINGNGASSGGGIKCDGSSPIVINNIIIGNTSYSSGGGIWSAQNSSPEITKNNITGNYTKYYGGGIYCGTGYPTIRNNIISGNTATGFEEDGQGGGIACDWSSPLITNNVITGNTVDLMGGGIYCKSSSPTITNNTLSGNTADIRGGGVYCYSSSPTIKNSILWDDIPEEIYVSSGLPTVTYSDVQGGYSGEGNINSDPLFVDPDNDNYFLQLGSPCVDVGDSLIPDACRPPGLVGERSDLGAYGGEGNCGWLEELVDLFIYPSDSLTVQKGDTLYFNTLIWNSTENAVAGDFWLSIVLPNSNEIVVPENFLNYQNPLSGQIPAHGSLNLSNELYIPAGAPSGSYRLIARIGVYPNNIIDEESFGFQVVE
jgi:parallel beta-helix repeat protein/predicted outer membrane repeat protein